MRFWSGFRSTGLSFILMVSALLVHDEAATAQTPVASPAAQPTALPNAIVPTTPVRISAGIGPTAAIDPASAKSLLGAVESQLAFWGAERNIRFVFDDAKDGECANVDPAKGKVDDALLEITHAHLISTDQNYVVVEQFSQHAELGFQLLSCSRTSLLKYPNIPQFPNAWRPWTRPKTTLSLLPIVGIASIANARNSNKTESAIVSFTGSFSGLKLPFYNVPSAQFDLLQRVGYDAVRSGDGLSVCTFAPGHVSCPP
ncbi:MAG: hypothetical protein M3169_09815 [Candidatus Eremiobacteraeota bacterium]|nr:hypothetical protein [Candidatus Eremiobacteraeota bacterium]